MMDLTTNDQRPTTEDKETRRQGDKETGNVAIGQWSPDPLISRSRGVLHALCLLLALLLAGCGGTPALSQQTTSYTVQLQLDALAVGDRTVTVDVKDQAGQPVQAQQVTLSPTMLSMGMASPQVTATSNGNGRYTGEKVLISMVGDWEMDVSIQHNGTTETARFLFTVPTQ